MKAIRTATTVTAILALSTIGGLLSAAPRGDRTPPPAPPIIVALDVNKDTTIDADEITNAPAALLTLDADGSGTLTKEEFCPPPPTGDGTRKGPGGPGGPGRRGPGGGPGGPGMGPMPVVAALDVNKDCTIDAEEIAGASAALLTLDKNADGALTIEELRPAPPTGDNKGGRGGQRGPGGQGRR